MSFGIWLEGRAGRFEVGPDPMGRTSDDIMYSPAIRWVQDPEDLLLDAIQKWKGSPTDIELHLRSLLSGAPEPDSGSGKIMRLQAEALLKAVRERSEPAPVLYRGSKIPPDQDPSILLGWSSSRRVARSFMRMYGGEVFILRGGRGLNLSRYPVHGMGEDEWIVLHNVMDGSGK